MMALAKSIASSAIRCIFVAHIYHVAHAALADSAKTREKIHATWQAVESETSWIEGNHFKRLDEHTREKERAKAEAMARKG